MDISFADAATHPALGEVLRTQLDVWPDHLKFLRRRLEGSDLAAAERVAELIVKLVADRLDDVCRDYQWLCERVLEEELHFRRTGSYRLTTFEAAEREVYANTPYMARYMNGLLLSQLWWSNHTSVLSYYADEFLPANPAGYRHVEVGPGHGLLLYFAARDPRASYVSGWDLSAASVEATGVALERMGVRARADLRSRNLFDSAQPEERFDSVVISEVCEHLENPREALESLRRVMTPGGRILVNMPINSPAPDHIYLLKTPEEVVRLVESAGYDVTATRFFPLTGYTEARARKANLTISCVVVGTRTA